MRLCLLDFLAILALVHLQLFAHAALQLDRRCRKPGTQKGMMQRDEASARHLRTFLVQRSLQRAAQVVPAAAPAI